MRLRILCKIFWWVSHFNSSLDNFERSSRFGDLWIKGEHIVNIDQVLVLDKDDLVDFFEDFMKCCATHLTTNSDFENVYKGT
mgnify:CR=1 FL=1